MDGSGGTYFLHDARKVKVAVFKPADEEPYAENNPKGYLRQPGNDNSFLRQGVDPGEACIREVAAYLLDHEGFSGVPMTTLVEARHPAFNANGARLKVSEGGASVGAHSLNPSQFSDSMSKKVGSFQEFCRSEFTMDDISPSKISVEEVHKIAILDIRIMNADRNSANLLCRRKEDDSLELVPIDHGFCLRSVADVSWMDWCWLDWPQLKKPLNERMKSYVLNLDIEADARLLRERLNLDSSAVDYFRASSRLLKAGVQAGLSLYDIACICCRNDDLGEMPSKLEMLFSIASDLAASAIQNGKWHHSAASRALVEQLSPCGNGWVAVRKSSHMKKSASTAHMQDIYGPVDFKHEVPGMSPSSDSSSESEEMAAGAEKEDFDEWAASVIANVSLDKSMSITKGKRSKSIDSEDSMDSSCLSSSPKGFWHVRPGSPSCEFSDEESVSWSPSSPELCSVDIVDAPLNCSIGLDDGNDYDFMLSPIFGDMEVETMEDHRPTVTFAIGEQKNCVAQSQDKKNPKLLGRADSGLTRSLSYSALSNSSKLSPDALPISKKFPQPLSKEYEQFRDYFLKFVDLVIVRETTAVSLQSKNI
jgi:hypothetical protein